jgi:hypothetical protein
MADEPDQEHFSTPVEGDKKNENKDYQNYKIPTGIYGLDQILFGGIQLYPQIFEKETSLSIVVYGETGTSKALFAMQLLHGITKFLRKLVKEIDFDPPFFISNKNKENIEDMLLDFLIAKGVNQIVEDNVVGRKPWVNSDFTNAFFEKNDVSRFSLDSSEMDRYIAEEIVVYNSRMNSLELAFPYKADNADSAYDNMLARRNVNAKNLGVSSRFNSIKIFKNPDNKEETGTLARDFFPILLYGKKEESDVCNDLKKCKTMIPCIVVDSDVVCPDEKVQCKEELLNLCNKALITIHIVNKKQGIMICNPDIIFEMRSYEDQVNKYFANQVRVSKSSIQTTALGWHRYKKRDYGIEIYPSLHLLLQHRRHMPKSILQSSYGILHPTFQQYIDKEYEEMLLGKNMQDSSFIKNEYEFYKQNEKEKTWEHLNDLYQSYNTEEGIDNILESLFIKPLNSNTGRCTAIIGSPNTYKRFLALGGAFSSCKNHIHTLDILMEKDDSIMRKRMICPAMFYKSSGRIFTCAEKMASSRCEKCEKCRIPKCFECYKYIHFKNIRMGYISSDEFIYYLLKQLRLSEKNHKIKRIILDDLQMIDYSFPLLKQDKLFLTALISICKEQNIDLFILCDKNALKVNELRFLADNVICTERKDNDIRFFIERFSGYYDPSHIYGCKISNISDLFFCKTDKEIGYGINMNRIDPIRVDNLDEFWTNNNI